MQFSPQTVLIMEWTALAFSLLYVFLIARQNIWCWACNSVGALLYAVVFYQSGLQFIALLQLYYFSVGIYGWITWLRGNTGGNSKVVKRLSPVQWGGFALAIPALMLVSLAAAIYFFDAEINWQRIGEHYATWMSVCAMVLAAKRYIENFIFWIAANIVSIIIFIEIKLYGTAGLYGLFIFTSLYGLWEWRRIARATGQ